MDIVERALAAKETEGVLLDAAAAILGRWWRTQDSKGDADEYAGLTQDEAQRRACRGLALLPLITGERFDIMEAQRAVAVEQGFQGRDAQIDSLPEEQVRALLKLVERIIAPARDLQYDDLNWVSDIRTALENYDKASDLIPMGIGATDYDIPDDLPLGQREHELDARVSRAEGDVPREIAALNATLDEMFDVTGLKRDTFRPLRARLRELGALG